MIGCQIAHAYGLFSHPKAFKTSPMLIIYEMHSGSIDFLQLKLDAIFFLEMVTVSSSPRPSSAPSSEKIPIETDYLKIAKKGGGHKG